MAGSDDWPIERKALDDLYLDPANVRIRGTIDDQNAILTHLLEREDALTLVRDIARDGYFDNEQPIVYVDADGRCVVLEGNRRTTALKVLNDPDRLPALAQRIRAAMARGDQQDFPDRIRVMIAPSKAAALQVIARLHTRDSKKSWLLEQQATFYYDRILDGASIADLRREYPAESSKIGRFVVMGQMMALARTAAATDPVAESFVNSSAFKMTTFEYLYNIAPFRSSAGMKVSSDSVVTFDGVGDEFLRRLFVQILLDMKDKRINTRNVKLTVPGFSTYIESLFQIAAGKKQVHDESEEEAPLAVSAARKGDLPSALPGSDAERAPGSSVHAESATNSVSSSTTSEGKSPSSGGSADAAPRSAGDSAASHGPDLSLGGSLVGDRAPKRHIYDDKLDFTGMPLRLPEMGLRVRYEELRRINVRILPNATYDIMRTFIECLIKVYFDAAGDPVQALDGRGGPVQLKDCLAHLGNRKGSNPLVNRTLALLKGRQFNSSAHYVASAQAFNNSNHDPATVFTQNDVNTMWSQLRPLVKLLLEGPSESEDVA